MVLDYPDYYTRARLKGFESRVYRIRKDVGNNLTIMPVQLPGFDLRVETLEWATDVEGDTEGGDGSLLMLPATYDVEGKLSDDLGLPMKDAVDEGFATICPASLNKWKSDVWELLNYDTVNSRFKIGLRRPLRLSNGFRLAFWNRETGATQKVIGQVVITLIGE